MRNLQKSKKNNDGATSSRNIKDCYQQLKKTILELDKAYSNANQSALAEKQNEIAETKKKLDSVCKKIGVSSAKDVLSCQLTEMVEQIRQIDSGFPSKEQELGNLESELNSLGSKEQLKASIAQLDNQRNDLEKKIAKIQKSIEHRGIVKILIQKYFTDKEQLQLDLLRVELAQLKRPDAEILKLSRIQETEEKKVNILRILSDMTTQRKRCIERKETIGQAINLWDTIESLLDQKAEIEQQLKKQEQSQDAVIAMLKNDCSHIFALQPELKDSNPDQFGQSPDFSQMLSFGNLDFFYKNKPVCRVPRLIPFPVRATILTDYDKEPQGWISNFIFRIFQCSPLQYIEITAVDPVKSGKSMSDFLLLLRHKRPFVSQKILTREDEIEKDLDSLRDYAESLIQKTFVGGISDWEDYNRKNPQNQLPYKLLVIFDVPEQLSRKSILNLQHLIAHGPKCGILPILSLDRKKLEEQKFSDLQKTLKGKSWFAWDMSKYSSLPNELKFLSFKETLNTAIPEKSKGVIIEQLASKFAVLEHFQGRFMDLISDVPIWGTTSEKEISTYVGWETESNVPITFNLGDMPTHVLLGGKSGSGKSNFLHVLICGLCRKYSPEELELYLLDYKEGTEFNTYAHPVLPHAKLIATKSDIEFGRTVLNHLVSIHEQRSELFKEAGPAIGTTIGNIAEYRQKTSKPLPRILLIVDEFQKLFDDDRDTSAAIEKSLAHLLRQGRSSGIHILLATQTIHGLQNQSRGQLLGNLSCRIALSCESADSALILGDGNFEAATLKSPPEAILNNSNGIKTANKRFNVPLAEKDFCSEIQHLLVQKAASSGYGQELKSKVFIGNTLPAMPDESMFSEYCAAPGLNYLLGEEYNFNAQPFVFNAAKENLLVAGYDQTIRNGLLRAIFSSLKFVSEPTSVLYLYTEGNFCPVSDISSPSLQILAEDAGNTEMSDVNDFINGSGQKVLIIDSFDYARKFQKSSPTSFLGKKNNVPQDLYELLMQIADPINGRDVRILLFVEDYNRFSTDAKDLLKHFSSRIGFGMEEDLAGQFVRLGAGYGKFKGLEGSTKAVFVDLKKPLEKRMIRPFV